MSNTVTFSTNTQPSSENNAGSSRTNVFISHRPSAASFFALRRRNMNQSQNSAQTSTSTNTSPPTTVRASPNRDEPRPRTSRSVGSQRPTMTNSSTQISPVAAQTINESLDLIRDILRDSGTRLLNLITNMSLSTLASVERSIPRRHHTSHSDDSEAGARPRHQRPRIRLFSSSLRREFLSSESDSDSDQSVQVDLSRTRNPSYQEEAETNSNGESSNQPSDRLVVELDVNGNDDAPNGENDSNRRINVSVSNNRFRVRSHSTDENRTRDGPNRERREARNDDRSQNSSANIDPSRPSTSRDNYWMDDVLNMSSEGLSSRPSIPSDEAFRKVRAGVNALHKHTVLLTDMWLRGSRTSMRDLRTMWENLRRRVLSLHRQTGTTDVPSYYTRMLMERCRFVAEMSRSPRRSPNRSARAARTNRPREEINDDRNNEDSQQTQMSTDSTSSSIVTENEQSTSAGPSTGINRSRLAARRASQLANLYSLYKLSARRRVQPSHRWRADEESRRRARLPSASRWSQRHGSRSGRRENARSFELYCTRNEIRMRAMQVLSVMFNMMMSCLEERGLSQLIIHMLRTLKKALALTCLMLMTNRLNRRENESPSAAANDETANANESENSQEPDEPPPENNQTTENIAEPVDESMDTHEQVEPSQPVPDTADRANDSNSTSSWPTSDSDDDNKESNKKKESPKKEPEPSTSQMNTEPENIVIRTPSPQPTPHAWSNRLAVQISAANRNNSATARNRRDLYLEIRRQKALHRTNPSANPITRKKILPPTSTYRIPEVRHLPVKTKNKAVNTNEEASSLEEPVAGPSNAPPGPSTDNNSAPSGSAWINETEDRANMFRIAHMHAVRLRTAARTRLRRLQTIRLYTPSSVREMFALQSNNNDAQSNQPLLNYASDLASRRQAFHAYRPHILARGNEASNREGSQQFDSILNNVAVPLVQVNDLPVEGQGAQPQRIPRVHDYLQPIILAQVILCVVCFLQQSP